MLYKVYTIYVIYGNLAVAVCEEYFLIWDLKVIIFTYLES